MASVLDKRWLRYRLSSTPEFPVHVGLYIWGPVYRALFIWSLLYKALYMALYGALCMGLLYIGSLCIYRVPMYRALYMALCIGHLYIGSLDTYIYIYIYRILYVEPYMWGPYIKPYTYRGCILRAPIYRALHIRLYM